MFWKTLAGTSVVSCALTAWGCGSGMLPSSPSTLSPLTTAGGNSRIRPLDDPLPAPDPAPPAEPAPTPPPSPMQVIIGIIGSFGAAAFDPNPIQANVGDQIVWANNDSVLHHIVLDDGTDLGDVAPGQSSAPMALTTPTASFHCTIHPSMVGSINGAILAPPPPDYYTPPPDDYGYY